MVKIMGIQQAQEWRLFVVSTSGLKMDLQVNIWRVADGKGILFKVL